MSVKIVEQLLEQLPGAIKECCASGVLKAQPQINVTGFGEKYFIYFVREEAIIKVAESGVTLQADGFDTGKNWGVPSEEYVESARALLEMATLALNLKKRYDAIKEGQST